MRVRPAVHAGVGARPDLIAARRPRPVRTAWATQMRLLLSTVLARIETEVGAGVVTEIVVRGPGGPSWRKGPLSAGGRGPRDTYG